MATLLGSGAIALWAFLALLSKVAQGVPPFELTALAFAISALLGLTIVAARGRLGALRQPALVWAHGVGGLFGYHALYFAALAFAPAAEANLINYTWPLLLALFAGPVLGLRLTRYHAAGIVLATLGGLLLTGTGLSMSGTAPLGYALAAGAAVTWALYSVLSRRLAAVPTEAVAGFCAGSAILAGVAHLLFEPDVMPSPEAWLAIAALGIGPTGSAFFLWDIGMKQGDPRLLGTLAYATPVLSTALLCLGGYAPWTLALASAALLVAAGGVLASRGR
jgi:drug/metabolite transporter (DMT)-like permease